VRLRFTFFLTFLGLVSLLTLAACGGGGSSSSGGGGGGGGGGAGSGSFTVSLSSTAVTLIQGGAAQTVQVLITAQNGFTGSVSVTANGLPTGVSISPSSLSVAPGVAGTFTFAASSAAGIEQSSGLVAAVSGTLSVNTPLEFSVSGPGVPDPFHMIGGEFSHGFYDQTRKLLFIANAGLNELDVISGADFSLVARVPVAQPWGIDQMADGNTLVIGSDSQQILTVNENTFAVTSHPVPGLGTISGLFYPNVVALANGKVLIIGQEQGIDSSDTLDGGQYVIEWDSSTNRFSQVEPSTEDITWETDHLARSADHKWAIFYGLNSGVSDQLYLYSSDADSFTTIPLSALDPPPQTYFPSGYAMNADGSKIAVAFGGYTGQVTFLDRSFNVLGTTQIPNLLQNARTAVMFTPDDANLLLQYDMPLAIEVVDANNYAALGYYSGVVEPEDNLERLLAVDSSGRAFVGIAGGVLDVELTGPAVPNPANSLPGALCPLPFLWAQPLNVSQVEPISNVPAGTSYYFGGQPAPLISEGPQIAVPASSVAGPVDIECILNGNTSVAAWGFSYGIDPIGVSANLLSPIGTPTVYISGFGFLATPYSPLPSASIGGQAATTVAASGPGEFGSFEVAAVTLPVGTSGASPSFTVSSANGSGSLANVVTYIPSATIVPSSGLLQVLYDTHRNLLYALKATEVDVLNPATLQWQTPFVIPGVGSSASYNTMALSPDGSWLVAVSPNGYAAVINPDNPTHASTVAIPPNNYDQTGSVAITKHDTAIVASITTNSVIDLSTLQVTPISGDRGNLIRASADGSALYGVDLNASSGQVYSIDPATFSVQSPIAFGYIFWSDLAVSSNGSQFAAIGGGGGAAGDLVGFYNSSMNLLNLNVYPLVSPPDDGQVLGSTYSPGGKVLVVPLGDSIEFWDVDSGTLSARLMTPEELNFLVFPEGPAAPQMALDTLGQTIYAISASGLSVMELAEPIDTMPAASWAFNRHPAKWKGTYSGGIAARISAMRKSQRNVKTH
jgi:hypothetical protein